MTYYATPRDEWPTHIEAASEPPVGPPLPPQERAVTLAELVALQREVHDFNGCARCGERCDICDERMCAEYGPEPAVTCGAHVECVECAAESPCRECRAARREHVCEAGR